jgi:hypothetical protein
MWSLGLTQYFIFFIIYEWVQKLGCCHWQAFQPSLHLHTGLFHKFRRNWRVVNMVSGPYTILHFLHNLWMAQPCVHLHTGLFHKFRRKLRAVKVVSWPYTILHFLHHLWMGQKKLECLSLASFPAFCNVTLACWPHSQATKNMKYCEYGPWFRLIRLFRVIPTNYACNCYQTFAFYKGTPILSCPLPLGFHG